MNILRNIYLIFQVLGLTYYFKNIKRIKRGGHTTSSYRGKGWPRGCLSKLMPCKQFAMSHAKKLIFCFTTKILKFERKSQKYYHPYLCPRGEGAPLSMGWLARPPPNRGGSLCGHSQIVVQGTPSLLWQPCEPPFSLTG